MTADYKRSANLEGKILASGQIPTQLITITGSPTGGTWTPAVNGVAAAAVAYNASAATLQTALQAVVASVTVTGSAGGPYTVTAPAGVAAPVTVSATALTGGTTPGVTMSGIDTTVYTVPGSSGTAVKTAVLRNNSAIPATFHVSVVPSGQSLDGTRLVAGATSAAPLAAGDSTSLFEIVGDFWEAGAFLSIRSPMAGAITYKLTGAVAS